MSIVGVLLSHCQGSVEVVSDDDDANGPTLEELMAFLAYFGQDASRGTSLIKGQIEPINAEVGDFVDFLFNSHVC